MPDPFWATHMTYAEVARKLGTSRQNIYQRGLRGSIPVDHDTEDKPGVPLEWVLETLRLRERGVESGGRND